jgi:protein TonB
MATMSGAVPPAPGLRGETTPDDDDQDLFTGLVVSNPAPRRRGVALPASIIGHTVAIASLVLVPILWPGDAPPMKDMVVGLIYNPPPPPPPLPPKGGGLVEQAPKQPETKPQVQPDPDRLTAEIPEVKPDPVPVEPTAEEVTGDANGSDMGVVGGDVQGDEQGVLGGTVGGVVGGVIGGTGDGPVMDFDQPPRLLHQVKPQYPQEAFVKKVEGVVELSVLIDAGGSVSQARVIRSIPLLDAAAVQCVRQWRFSPAIKDGRPVATEARVPITFRIF